MAFSRLNAFKVDKVSVVVISTTCQQKERALLLSNYTPLYSVDTTLGGASSASAKEVGHGTSIEFGRPVPLTVTLSRA